MFKNRGTGISYISYHCVYVLHSSIPAVVDLYEKFSFAGSPGRLQVYVKGLLKKTTTKNMTIFIQSLYTAYELLFGPKGLCYI